MSNWTKAKWFFGLLLAGGLFILIGHLKDRGYKLLGMLSTPAEASISVDNNYHPSTDYRPEKKTYRRPVALELYELERIHDCLWVLEQTESSEMPTRKARYLAVYSAIARAEDNKAEYGGSDICNVVFHRVGGRSQYSGVWTKNGRRKQPIRQGKWAEVSSRIVWDVLLGRWVPTGEERKVRNYLNPEYSDATGIRWFNRSTKLVAKVDTHEYRRPIEPGEKPDMVLSQPRSHKKRLLLTSAVRTQTVEATLVRNE